MRTMILLNGDMVITIPKEEKEQQLQHLYSLIPCNTEQYDEITELLDLVLGKPKGMDKLSTPHLKLIIGGKS